MCDEFYFCCLQLFYLYLSDTNLNGPHVLPQLSGQRRPTLGTYKNISKAQKVIGTSHTAPYKNLDISEKKIAKIKLAREH